MNPERHRETGPIEVLRVVMADESLHDGRPAVRLLWMVGDEVLHNEQFWLDEHGRLPEHIDSAWQFVLSKLWARSWPAHEELVRYAQIKARAAALGVKLIEGQGQHEIEMVDDGRGVIEIDAGDFDDMEVEVHSILDRVQARLLGRVE